MPRPVFARPVQGAGVGRCKTRGIAVVAGGGGFLCSAIRNDLAKRGAKVAVLELRLEAARRSVDEDLLHAQGTRNWIER